MMTIQNQKKILFVEDDDILGFVVKDHLILEGYDIEWIKDGQTAFETFENSDFNKKPFDLCIFDVMLPKLDGFELAKKVRSKNENIPILFLTAKSLQEDRLHALRIGADDYLTKPFSIEELVLKMEIFLKRSVVSPNHSTQNSILRNSTIKIGTYTFDVNNLSLISVSQKKHSLTSREAELLELFCQNKEQVLRREFILKQLWGNDDYFLGRSLDVFISRLRKYLKEDETVQIENIPRVGFRLASENK